MIAIAADMTVGQFETFRVNEALRELGAQISAGRLPGVRTATVAAEKVTASSIPLLEPGSPAPGGPKTRAAAVRIGAERPEFFAIAAVSEPSA